jgi:subtilisin family serine protease
MTDHVPQPRARVRLRRRLLATGAATALAAAMLTVHASGATAIEDPTAHVDSGVLADLAANGTAEFFVYLDERPDLAPATGISNRVSRAQFVYDQLTTTAAASQAEVRALLEAHGADFTPFWITNAILVQGDRTLLEQLAAHPDVTSIGPNETVPLIEPVASGPADNTIQAVEWGVANINADDVWADFGVTGVGIVVATIDTGVQFNHPALVNQYRGNLGGGSFDHNYNWHDPSAICSPGVPCDNHGHGTHVTGTMVGDDGGSNQIGVAPGAKWIAAKGCEVSSCSQGALLSSGQWMVAPTDVNGNNPDPSKAPHVVNNSWGGGGGNNWYMDIVDAWVNAGIFPMFSNGNSGPSCGTAGSPGDYPQSYGVGAYDINNNIAGFSSRGPSAFGGIKPNISAPGVSVRSSLPTNSYGLFSGTSMASPHASGVVALVWSAASDLIGDISGTRSVLDTTARDVSDLQCGGSAGNNNVWGEGRIDAHAAVTLATGGEPPPPPPPPDELIADFTWSCPGSGGQRTCTFNGGASVGDIVSWHWHFGDGNATGSGEIVSHTYQGGRSRTVTLTVTDVDNNTDTISQTVNP